MSATINFRGSLVKKLNPYWMMLLSTALFLLFLVTLPPIENASTLTLILFVLNISLYFVVLTYFVLLLLKKRN
jgi:predicted MFS family arabinose efflux permease